MAKGDHIKVSRFRGLYTHHGIDMGDGTVVHFSGEPLRPGDADVRRDTLDEFLRGGAPRVVRYAAQVEAPDTVVETALKFVGTRGYRLWTNNCEHFAVYCKTGQRQSRQVRRVALAAATTSAATVAFAGAAFAARALAARAGRDA